MLAASTLNVVASAVLKAATWPDVTFVELYGPMKKGTKAKVENAIRWRANW